MGAEAAAVLGVISLIISIIEGIKKVYNAVTNAKGLPKAFREVAGRLPVVKNILGLTKQYINNNLCTGAKHVAEACEKKAKKLDKMFHKAIPAEGALDLKRYYKAVKAYRKGSKIENLIKGILKDI